MPPLGVYPVYARTLDLQKKTEGDWMQGVLNYGKRPTFKSESSLTAEVHILSFQGDLYGKTLEIAFGPRIRGEKAFESADALKRQIAQDIDRARQFFTNSSKLSLYK